MRREREQKSVTSRPETKTLNGILEINHLSSGTNSRPILIREYIERENIPVVDLYFARNGFRYRSLGCAPCTKPVQSTASSVPAIIAELRDTKLSERSTRAQDQESEDAFERLRASGYM